MKARITILLAITACCSRAIAADNFPAITTTDGKTYDHITDQRADPDGLYIEYTTPGNGLGCAKIKFTRLSADLQKQYGYDADAAKKYEEGTYKAQMDFQAWADKQDAASEKAREAADARDFQEETLIAQLARQSAPSAQPANPGSSIYIYGGGWPYGAYGRLAPPNSWTGSTFKGLLPADRLFTPMGFSATRTQALSATPRSSRNSSTESERQR